MSTSLGSCSDRTSADIDPLPQEVREYARAKCDKVQSCECAATGYSNREECESRIASIYTRSIEPLADVDLDCFLHAAQAWSASQCDFPAEIEWCETTSRADEAGSICDPNLLTDPYVHTPTCATGLTCADGLCVEAPTDNEIGDPCSPAGRCGSDLTCIANACVMFRTIGEPCETSFNCDPFRELHCRENICTERTSNGDFCTEDGECKLGVPCVENRCTPISPIVCITADF